MKNFLVLLSLLISTPSLHAQLTSQKFITGRGQQAEGCWDAFIMDFASTPPGITAKPGPVFLGNGGCRAHMTVSDRNGNLQFGFDCRNLYNRNFTPMHGAENLVPVYNSTNGANNYNWQQGVIALPIPGNVDEKYYIFYLDKIAQLDFGVNKLMYGVVDMQMENGLGELVSRDHLLFADTTSNISGLSAVRHGNGKDWWLFCYLGKKGYRFYRFLVTKDGIEPPLVQDIYNPTITDLSIYDGATSLSYGFSPDGTKLARFPPVNFVTYLTGVEYYDFDRCTGELSNLQFYLPDSLRWGQTVWSPNSRFIYAVYFRDVTTTSLPFIIDSARSEIVLQIDTWNPDTNTNAYRVFELPMFLPLPHPNAACPETPSPSRVSGSLLGLNGKVYINSEQSFFSTIHQPDSLGAACDFRYGDLLTNQMFRSMPAYINYQLYDKSNSPCDTSGVNGYTSVFEQEGMHSHAEISPNPVAEQLHIKYRLHQGETQAVLRLYDITGRELVKHGFTQRDVQQQSVPVNHLPEGLYFWSLTDGAGVVGSGKVVKM